MQAARAFRGLFLGSENAECISHGGVKLLNSAVKSKRYHNSMSILQCIT